MISSLIGHFNQTSVVTSHSNQRSGQQLQSSLIGLAGGGIVTPVKSSSVGVALPRLEMGSPNSKSLEAGIQQLSQEFRGLSDRLVRVLDRPQQVTIDGTKLGNNTMALYQGIKAIMEVGT
jgi:hypothetical protein